MAELWVSTEAIWRDMLLAEALVAVSLNQDLDVLQNCMCPGLNCKTHLSLMGPKHPQTVPIFMCTLASKWPQLLVPLNALFRRVTSNLHVQYRWTQVCAKCAIC